MDWDGEQDPLRPRNWTLAKKLIHGMGLFGLTMSAYMGTAIFMPAAPEIKEHFGCTHTQFMLGLTLFIWGYGLGPLIFAPMSEDLTFRGRKYIYFAVHFVFTILQVPTALANHVASFAVLRFLAGVAAAPPLTIGAGTLSDMFLNPWLTFAIAAWNLAFIAGPYISPLIGAALTHANSWRWSFWYLCIQAGATWIYIVCFMSETSEQALLLRKAQILRRVTGNSRITSAGEISLARRAGRGSVIADVLWQPVRLAMQEPVLNFMNVHLGLVYAVVFLFFEGFPIVYGEVYHFTRVEQGAAYLSMFVGFVVALVVYVGYIHHKMVAKKRDESEPAAPEAVFVPSAIVSSCLVPIGLFIMGWTSTCKAHWIGSMVGGLVFSAGTWTLFQSYFAYLGQLYPFRFASAMALNSLTRCLIAGAFPLFGEAFYRNTSIESWPVGWGYSILGFLSLAMIMLPVYLYLQGANLRRRAYRKYGDRDN